MCLPLFAPLGVALGAAPAAAAAAGTVAATSIGLGAASAGLSIAAQQQAAREQNSYRQRLGIAQNRAFAENVVSVRRDIGLQVDQAIRRDIEQQNAVRQELSNISRDVIEAGAKARTATAGAGVEGRTVDLLHDQFNRQVAEFESAASRNIKTFRAQTEMEVRAIYSRGQSAINNGYPAPLPPVATVSPATSILNGITTGISIFGTLNPQFTPPGGVGTGASAVSGNPALTPGIQSNLLPNYVGSTRAITPTFLGF